MHITDGHKTGKSVTIPGISVITIMGTHRHCPLHTNSGCGKERRMLIGQWRPAKAALVRNYLTVY